MFLDIEGIDGESLDSIHKDEIDVLAWSWGASQSGTMHIGGGGGAGKATFMDLSVVKQIDKASPKLMLYCANGNHITEAELVVRKSGASPLEYIKITMTKVIITSVNFNMDAEGGGDPVPTEEITLNFESFRLVYVPQNPDGSAGAPIEIEWNIATDTGGLD
jgi:type VI secretion system secreted protein Hcp